MGEQGCVSWMFTPTGKITLKDGNLKEDDAFEIASKINANDIQNEDGHYVLIVDPKTIYSSKDILEKENIAIETVETVKIPNTWVSLEGEKAFSLLKLLTELEDHDDVDEVFGNYEISDADMEKFYDAN
jgi:transcriptional/translational regulatory protein YebC/TACO1